MASIAAAARSRAGRLDLRALGRGAGPALAVWAVTRWLLLAAVLADTAAPGDGVMGLTLSWVYKITAGADPYAGTIQAYPPLAMLGFVIPGATTPGLATYKVTFALAMLVVDLVGLVVAVVAERSAGVRHAALAYAVALPSLGAGLVLWRYDLAPAVASLICLTCVLNGRLRPAAAALGIGIALKPYGLVLVPLLALWLLRGRLADRTEAVKLAAWVVLPTVVSILAFLPWASPDASTRSYGFQVARDATQDSSPAALASVVDAKARAATVDHECECLVRTGSTVDAFRLAGTLLLLGGYAGLLLGVWRRPTAVAVVLAANAALALLVLVYPVFSPQYLSWLAVPIVLAGLGGRLGLGALGATVVAVALSGYSFPELYPAIQAWTGWGPVVVVGRVLVEALATGLLAAALWRLPAPAARVATA